MRVRVFIIALLAATATAKASAISGEALGRLTAAHLAKEALLAATAESFADFYQSNFGGKANIQQNLLAMTEEERAAHFASVQTPAATEEEFLTRAATVARDNLNSLVAGRFEVFQAHLQADLLSLFRATFKKDLHADKWFLYPLLGKLLGQLDAQLSSALQGINSPPLLHGLKGADYETVKGAIVTKLRRSNIQLQLAKATLVLAIAGDFQNKFNTQVMERYTPEIDSVILEALREDLSEESEEFVKTVAAPAWLRMLALKQASQDWQYWNWANIRVNTLIGNSLSNHNQKAWFRAILANSQAEPGQSLETVQYADRFRAFVMDAWENNQLGVKLEYSEWERKYLYLDYLAVNPEAVELTYHSLQMFDLLSRYNGNINNFLFFLRFFKYYPTDMSEPSAVKAREVFRELYRILLSQRNTNDNIGYAPKDWVEFINERYFSTVKNDWRAKYVPSVAILTALALDPATKYYSVQYQMADKDMEFFKAVSANDDFLIDYKRFLSGVTDSRQYPKATWGTVLSIVLPEAGQLTEDERAVLSDPEILDTLKAKLVAGQRLIKMTDLDAEFQSEEDVYVLVVEREGAVCNRVGCKVLEEF